MGCEMTITLKTLTPLWTGGVDGTMDRVHETGILGSLRWWYEAIVRGLGGWVCDPTSDEKCRYDPKDPRPPKKQLCAACYVFGATGWQRRFRISVVEDDVSDAAIQHPVRANRSYTDRKGKTRTPTWYFPHKPKKGVFFLQIQPLGQEPPEIMAGLVQFVADWAGLGARTQMGFGVVEPVESRVDPQTFYEHLRDASGSDSYPTFPSLKNIFLARIRSQNGLPLTEQDIFNLKYDLRRLFAHDRQLRHFVMGTVRGKRIAAKVKTSRPYGGGWIRVWGWIPEDAEVYDNSWDRNRVVDTIYQHLDKNYAIEIWREMNSSRDHVRPNESNPHNFLGSLLAQVSG